MASTSTSTVTNPQYTLPNELWLDIFRIATQLPVDSYSLQNVGADYLPFHHPSRIHPAPRTTEEEEIWETKLALTLVSKHWKALSAEYVYEFVYFGHHWRNLLEGLMRSQRDSTDGRGYGPYVKRIALSASSAWKSAKLGQLMKWCTNAEVLVKRDDDVTLTPTSEIQLASLKRFDWWYTTCRDSAVVTNQSNNFSRGRDLFRAIVSQASNLIYLSIGIRYPTSRISEYPPRALTLESLSILRVQHIGTQLRAELEGWSFPKLTHIITDSSLLWDTDSPLFSPRIEVLEFVKDETLETLSALSVINHCPNLRELNYYVEFARFPFLPIQSMSLECIRLHSGKNFMLHYDGSDVWSIYDHHFSWIAKKESFPGLRRVVLHGDWDYIIQDARWKQIATKVVARGCDLRFSNGTAVLQQCDRELQTTT